METEARHLFVSYARQDSDLVRPVAEAVKRELKARNLPVELWLDVDSLHPGESWERSILSALESSIGFLFFVSPQSLRSEWIRRELEYASRKTDRLIIPVIVSEPENDLPYALGSRQWLDLSRDRSQRRIQAAATQIVAATESFLKSESEPQAVLPIVEAPMVAADIAQQVRAPVEPESKAAKPGSVFVVHGHNAQALAKLEEYLAAVGIGAVVLSRQHDIPQSLFQKFMAVAAEANFAIVLLSADDYGASRRQFEAPGVGDRSLQFRARQNVILELGFFYGRLGWENVFVVYQEPEQVFPNFERPSDLDGVVFDSFSDPTWRERLGARLVAAGFELSPSQ